MLTTTNEATGDVTLAFGGVEIILNHYHASQLDDIVGRNNHDVAAEVCLIIRRAVSDGKVAKSGGAYHWSSLANRWEVQNDD